MQSSPSLFNLYIQDALNKVNEVIEGGVMVQGERIKMLRFADNIAIIDYCEQGLNNQLHAMEEVLSKEHNLKINIKKTKSMACSNNGRTKANIRLN